MITIFNGRKRAIGDSKDEIYVQVATQMREYGYLFKNGHDINAAWVFMTLALHANADGWAWPSTALLNQETGLTTQAALSRCIQHLRTIQIDEKPILHHYRLKENGQWGRSYYHIFPVAGGADHPPVPGLQLWVWAKPTPAKQGLAKQGMVKQGYSIRITSPKNNHSKDPNIAPTSGAEFSHSVNQADREPEPAVTGDPDPGKKKVAAKKKDADAPKSTTELKNAVATLCFGDADAWKSGTNAAAMSKALRDLLSVCPQLTPGSLEAFGKWWHVNDFRGKDGKLPAPHNVAQEWANCKKWHAEHGKSAAASAGPSLTPGYVQDPDFPGISIPIGQLRARRESEIAQKRDSQ